MNKNYSMEKNMKICQKLFSENICREIEQKYHLSYYKNSNFHYNKNHDVHTIKMPIAKILLDYQWYNFEDQPESKR